MGRLGKVRRELVKKLDYPGHLTNRCHIETSPVKAGTTNVRDNAILPPTASGDGAGA
jgi:hypothetical protein